MKIVLKFFSELRRRNVVPTLLPYMGIAWLILQIVQAVSATLYWPSWVATVTTIVFLVGFPVMAYIAWYFDITTDGLVKIPDVTGEINPLGKWQWSGLLVVCIVSLWLGHQLYLSIRTEVSKSHEGINTELSAQSIAVLPFIDLTPDQSQLYLAQGIADEITSLLGQNSELSIAATRSTFALSERNLTPIDIGKRLNVDTVLSGSVRVNGNRLKIRAELVDVDNGHIVWSNSFTRKFINIFEVEEEISRSIANLLHDRYLAVGEVTTQAKTASTDAYVIYLKGRQSYRKQTTEQFKIARKHFEQAIALDPEYVSAYISLANTILMLEKGSSRYGILDTDIAIKLAEQHLANALIRNPENADAYTVQGKLFELKHEYENALSSYDKAISLNPSLALAHMWRYLILTKLNRFDESLLALQTAYRLDPLSSTNIYNLGYEYSRRARHNEATELFNQLINEFPESPQGYIGHAHNAYVQGFFSESLKQWHLATKLSPENDNYRSRFIGTLLSLGLTDEVRKITQDDTYKTTLLMIDGNKEALFKELDFQLASYPDDPWLMFEAAWYQMLSGNLNQGSELLLSAADNFSDADLFAMPYCSPAIEVAWAIRHKNTLKIKELDKNEQNFEHASRFIDRCSKQLKQAQQNQIVDSIEDYLAVRIAVLNNKPQQALALLETALEHGWLEWWTSQDPILQSLRNNEQYGQKFAQLMSSIQERLANEKTLAQNYLKKTALSSPKSTLTEEK